MQVVDLTDDIRKTCEGMGKGSQKKEGARERAINEQVISMGTWGTEQNLSDPFH